MVKPKLPHNTSSPSSRANTDGTEQPRGRRCQGSTVKMRIFVLGDHDFRRTAVRNLERAGVPRSVAMKITGHKTESVYRRYANVSEADLTEVMKKLAVLHASDQKRRAKQALGTVWAQNPGRQR